MTYHAHKQNGAFIPVLPWREGRNLGRVTNSGWSAMVSTTCSFAAPSSSQPRPMKRLQRLLATTALSAMMMIGPELLVEQHFHRSYSAAHASAEATASDVGEVLDGPDKTAELTPRAAVAAEGQGKVKDSDIVEQVWDLVNKYFYNDETLRDIDWGSEHGKLLEATEKRGGEDRGATYGALRKAIGRLNDRYTRLLTASQMQSLRKYDVSGVGLMLTQDDANGDLVVSSDPVRDSSAGRAGIRRGDVIEAIDGRSIAGVDAFTVSEWMQGRDGSVMNVKVKNSPKDYELVRSFPTQKPSVQSVAVVPENDHMGYIHLRDFTASSRNDVADALRTLRKAGAQWVVLDLRGNGGGVFEGALEIAAFFVGDDVPMVKVYARQPAFTPSPSPSPSVDAGTSVNKSSTVSESFKTKLIGDTATDGDNAWKGIDLAILMDSYSASSSEVLAAGLHENCAAAIAGDRSYGKGVIQGLFGLADGGGLAVTVAEYRTPNGATIDGVGVTPDLRLQYESGDKVLKVIGIERHNERAFVLSHDDVRQALRMCREQGPSGQPSNT